MFNLSVLSIKFDMCYTKPDSDAVVVYKKHLFVSVRYNNWPTSSDIDIQKTF